MTPIKIGIVEDDLIIAEAITEMLQECGYSVTEPAMRYSEAMMMIEQEQPDLLLLDVNILGKMDGIEIGRTVQRSFGIPFIFLTANTDFDTISRAKGVTPAAFLAKPITKAQLYAAVEIAMANNAALHDNVQDKTGAEARRQQPLFVKDGYNFRKIDEQEILYIESEQNYLMIHLADKRKVLVRTTIGQFAGRLDERRFIQVHRGFIAAISKVEKVSGNILFIAGREVPVSKGRREDVLRALGIKG